MMNQAAASNPHPHSRGAGMIDPVALMRIRSMELRARAIVHGFWKGIHRSPFHGFSAEFTEYRQYTHVHRCIRRLHAQPYGIQRFHSHVCHEITTVSL